jgi:hypothetical protein
VDFTPGATIHDTWKGEAMNTSNDGQFLVALEKIDMRLERIAKALEALVELKRPERKTQ